VSQLLTLSRAAQIIGVTRGELQKRIRDGELAACDGMVATVELQRVFPEVRLEDSGAFEHITTIKEQAFGRRVRERVLPSPEILAQRILAQSEELAELRRAIARYHDLIEALRVRIDELAPVADAPLTELGRLLDAGLAAVLAGDDKPDTLATMDAMLRIMAAHVTVKPSGREFFVEGSESILAAALRAGLSPAYGCGNGACGLCKARVVSGAVRPTQHCDYPLSAAEKAQNYTLLCSHTAVSDVVVEMLEADAPEDIPEQHVVARVRSVAPLGAQTMLLHLQTPRANRLRFLAGQSATLGVAGGTADFAADYPIASCPCDDRNLLFHIPQADDDEFALRLFAGAIRPGDSVSVRGPWGRFILGKDSLQPILFLCCDTGFAPVRSLIEHALALDVAESMTLAWVATRADGHYAGNQCRAWADALDNFRYLAVGAGAGDGAAAAQALLASLDAVADLGRQEIYIAGGSDFVTAMVAALGAAGVAATGLRTAVC
jgi:CDP-4-dehydro-6-deoxyglucose reductase